SRREATEKLRALCAEHGLCPPLLGIEKRTAGRCFTYQVKRCRGACLGAETREAHTERLAAALASLKVASWPYEAPVGIVEGADLHVVHNWCHYGTLRMAPGAKLNEAAALVQRGRPAFDLDTYKILLRMMPGHDVIPLQAA